LGLVDLVGGRRGGLYGFISSHAANTFGAFMFVTLYLRRFIKRRLLVVLSSASVFLWAFLSSYSRIYLGLHYPGDILFGSLSGLLIGWLVFRLFIRVGNRLLNHREEQSVVGLRELSPLLLPITFLLTLVSLSLLAL
jgi:undecaprenyl-diphosphatase